MARVVGYRPPVVGVPVAGAVLVSDRAGLEAALWDAGPGSVVYLRGGVYTGEDLWVAAAGAAGDPLLITAYPGEVPVLSFSVHFEEPVAYLEFRGVRFADRSGLEWEPVVDVQTGVHDVVIADCEITNIFCTPGLGFHCIYVHGSDTGNPVHDVTVVNNWVHDCDTGWSEAISVAGNAYSCVVERNTVDTTGNIGIDVIGNYGWEGTPGNPLNQARDIRVVGNLVSGSASKVAAAAGLYSDGARDVLFEHNVVSGCQIGIELGAEEPGVVSENLYVRNNLIVGCGRSIGIGGYQETSAAHRNVFVYNNTVVSVDGGDENYGVLLERTSNVEIRNNIFWLDAGTDPVRDWGGTSSGVVRDHNCWYGPTGGLPAGDGPGSWWGDPGFVRAVRDVSGDFRLAVGSGCVDAGLLVGDLSGSSDLDGGPRLVGAVDVGAYERAAATVGGVWNGTRWVVPEVWNGTRWVPGAECAVWNGTRWVPVGESF